MDLIWFVRTQIMDQYTSGTNEVGVEILYLKVEYLNRLIQFLAADSIDKCIFAALELQLVVQLQILRSNPTLALYIEGMLGGTGNGVAIDLNMYQLVLLVQEGSDYAHECTFAGLRILLRPVDKAAS